MIIRCRLFISRNHKCFPEKGSLKTLFLTFSHFSGSFLMFFFPDSLILFLFFFLFYCFNDGTMPTVNFPKLQVLQIINMIKYRNLIKCPKPLYFYDTKPHVHFPKLQMMQKTLFDIFTIFPLFHTFR